MESTENTSKSKSAVKKRIRGLLRRRRRLLFVRTALKTGSAVSFLLACVLFAAAAIQGSFLAGWTRSEVFLLGLFILVVSWAVATVAAGIYAFLTHLDPIMTAKSLDDRYGFKDQVASALDLSGVDREFAHAAGERANQLLASTRPREVFPFSLPRMAALTAAAVILLTLAATILFDADLSASQMREDISALADRLRRYALEREKEARTKEERDVLKRLKKLADQLKKKEITKKKALEEAAALRKALGKKHQELSMKGFNLRKAAEALAKCKDTRPIAKELLRRNVRGAADSTKELADAVKGRKALKENTEFEKLSEAFHNAAPYMGPLRSTSQRIARASRFYERDTTSRELNNLARQMKQDAEAAQLSDLLQGGMRALEQLQEGLGGIREFKRGKGARALSEFMLPHGSGRKGSGAGMPGGKGMKRGQGLGRTLGSLKDKEKGPGIGRGTDPNLYGKTVRQKSQRDPYLLRPNEAKGKSEYFQVKSAREAARSGVDYKNIFVNYKRRAENTLYSEQVPIGYREYVRRYFENIRPPEDPAAKDK